MVILHIILITAEIFLLYVTYNPASAKDSREYLNIESSNSVLTAIIDIFVCCLICIMLSDFNFVTRFKPDAQPIMTSSSEGSTSRDSDETPEEKSARQILRF
jgi:hypothetical protein